MRAGKYIQQPRGYRAFIPAPLPPDPPIEMDEELTRLLSEADRALGRLDGVASVLPNTDLFVAMYVRHEAVLSSQIEGTESTLQQVLEFEASGSSPDTPADVEEVVNYVAAMNHGLTRLDELPLSLRLIQEIHARLMEGVRGGERAPGEFRKTQNWIGPKGCALADATFVPPPPHEMKEALAELEGFLYRNKELPALITCGLAHAQFETIHPFLDGNGRVGRLLIAFLLCQRDVLQRPLLYLSVYLKAQRAEYYDRLMAVRNSGDWEGWIKFFLRGVAQVSREATDTARGIVELREHHRQGLAGDANALSLLDHLFEHPVLTVRSAERFLGTSYVTASKAVRRLEETGLLEETTGQQRNRRYRFAPYLNLFQEHAKDPQGHGSQ